MGPDAFAAAKADSRLANFTDMVRMSVANNIVREDLADIATFPWVRNLVGFYGAGELVGIGDFPQVTRVLEAFIARPAVARGLAIPARPTAN